MIQTRGFGVSLSANASVSNVELLKQKMEKIAELGFHCAEIPIQGMQVIRNGAIDDRRLQLYVDALRQFPLRYTTHAPFDLNVFRADEESRDIDRLAFMAALEVSGAMGAETMVYHVGRFVGEEQFLYAHQWPRWTEAEKQQLLEEERTFLRLAGDRAAELDLRIGMENMRPYLDCPAYCYAVIPRMLAEQVREIDHPGVGITLDTGHAYLASKMYQLDLRREIEAVSPYIVHLHVHDNYGRACYSTEKNQKELLVLGRGDMHAPIGDGSLPFRDMMGWIGDAVDAYVIHEVRDMYEGEWPALGERWKEMTG